MRYGQPRGHLPALNRAAGNTPGKGGRRGSDAAPDHCSQLLLPTSVSPEERFLEWGDQRKPVVNIRAGSGGARVSCMSEDPGMRRSLGGGNSRMIFHRLPAFRPEVIAVYELVFRPITPENPAQKGPALIGASQRTWAGTVRRDSSRRGAVSGRSGRGIDKRPGNRGSQQIGLALRDGRLPGRFSCSG